MSKHTKSKHDSHNMMYIALVSIVAIVAVVLLLTGRFSDTSTLVVDEEGNLVGEAKAPFRSYTYGGGAVSGSSSFSKVECDEFIADSASTGDEYCAAAGYDTCVSSDYMGFVWVEDDSDRGYSTNYFTIPMGCDGAFVSNIPHSERERWQLIQDNPYVAGRDTELTEEEMQNGDVDGEPLVTCCRLR